MNIHSQSQTSYSQSSYSSSQKFPTYSVPSADDSLYLKWDTYFNEANWDDLESLYCTKFTLDIPGRPSVHDTSILLTQLKEIYELGFRIRHITLDERYYDDGHGYMQSTSIFHKKGEPDNIHEQLRGAAFYKRDSEGKWQIEYEIFNHPIVIACED